MVVPRRNKIPGSLDETRRVPVVDLAPTRMFRQGRPGRHVRTPVWSPTVVAIDPDARSSPLPHPRLVRRARR